MKNLPAKIVRSGLPIVVATAKYAVAKITKSNVEHKNGPEQAFLLQESKASASKRRRIISFLISFFSLLVSFAWQSEPMTVVAAASTIWFLMPTKDETILAEAIQQKIELEKLYKEEAARQKARVDAELYRKTMERNVA